LANPIFVGTFLYAEAVHVETRHNLKNNCSSIPYGRTLLSRQMRTKLTPIYLDLISFQVFVRWVFIRFQILFEIATLHFPHCSLL